MEKQIKDLKNSAKNERQRINRALEKAGYFSMPTLNEAIEVLNKQGGFFKGKGDGSVRRETE